MSIFVSANEVADREAKNKIYGVVIGIVTQNSDKDKHTYRVKVRFPWLPHSSKDGTSDDKFDESGWARIASFMAGDYIGDKNDLGPRGAFFMPEIGDEVLVAFEHGDISRPIVIGRLWSDVKHDAASNGDAKPNRPVYSHTEAKGVLSLPVDGGKDDGSVHAKTKHGANANDLSGLRTRSGHALVFNDAKDGGAVYLRTAKNHRFEMVDGDDQGILLADAKGNYVWLKSGKQGGDIEVHTEGNIKLTAKKDITLEAEGNIKATSTKAKIEVTAKQSYTLKAAGFTLDSSASGTIKAASGLKLSGHPINLN